MSIRGVLHIHSTYSYDGQESLVAIKAELVALGISFACITEHVEELDQQWARQFIQECSKLSDSNFVLIPGFEVPYLGTHIIIVGAYSYSYAGDAQTSIQQWVQAGACAIVAHPHRNNFASDEFMLQHTIGSEIWNSQYDGKSAPRPAAWAWFRKLKKNNNAYFAFGSIDLHRLYHIGGPEMVVESVLDPSSILSAIREGRFHIKKGDTLIDSSGTVREGSPFMLSVVGAISVGFITIGKKISRILRHAGFHQMPLLRHVRRAVRKNV